MGKRNKQKFPRRSKFYFTGTSKQDSKAPSKEYVHGNQLQEADVGITQFISTLEGYSGIIKARFSDFQVNEINLNGEIAKLTDPSIPKDFDSKQQQNHDGAPELSPIQQIPQDTWLAIRQMIEGTVTDPVEMDATTSTKQDRVDIHECIKGVFGKKIFAKTEARDDKKVMTFHKHEGEAVDNRFCWPKDKGEYVHFLVYKECQDTMDASLKIAACIKMSASHLTYAGVKDKRAKTTQWFCIKKIQPWKLITKTKCLRNIRIGNLMFKDKPLRLGDLSGNRFRIALRNVTGTDHLIRESLENVKEKGFINYYGLQRFGNNKEVPTFAVGVELLLGNWKEACQLILKPTDADQKDLNISKAKRVYLESGDAKKALDCFGNDKNSCIECLLLTGLSKGHSNDFVNALTSVPRNTRLLYINSFQSLVWNIVASKRIEKFGLEVVEGDLVLIKECNDEETVEEHDEKKPKVKAVALAECGDYCIYDVVLPLPGYNITYPENVKEFYKEVLEKYGLTLEMTKQKVEAYSLRGDYRKVLGQVKDLSWRITHYNEPDYNLIRSDLEELKQFNEPEGVEGGKYKAVVLELSLNPSSYATMVLREILKTDTSSSSHAKLNNYHVTLTKEKKILVEDEVKETSEDLRQECDKDDLLNDAVKYNQFKNIVFNEGEPLKRKLEDDAGQSENVKVAKTSNAN